MSSNPPWFDALAEGLFAIARARRVACESGAEDDGDIGPELAFIGGLLARERFLADMERLATAPGATAAEVEQAAAGILALAAIGG